MASVVNCSKGFSLLEMMIALVIMLFTLLALASSLLHSININLDNEIRNTAIRLTNQTAEIFLALPIDSIETCGMTPDPTAPNYDASMTYDSANICLEPDVNDYLKYPNLSW